MTWSLFAILKNQLTVLNLPKHTFDHPSLIQSRISIIWNTYQKILLLDLITIY